MNKTTTNSVIKNNTSKNLNSLQNKDLFTLNSFKQNNNKKNNSINTKTKNNNQMNTSSQSSGVSTSNMFGIIILVVVIIGLIGGSYWIYNFYSTRNFQSYVEAVLVTDVTDSTIMSTIESSTVPTSSYSNEYSISMWINVQDYNYNYGTEKTIISRGQKGAPGNPEIVLGSKHNDLIVRVKLQGGSKSVSKFEDIPIQLPSNNTGIGFIKPETLNQNVTGSSISKDQLGSQDYKNITDNFVKIGSNNIDYPTIQYTFDNNDSDNQCGYFDLVSGNTINIKSNTTQNNGNKLVEGFTNVDDAINASVKVIVDICNISTTMQSQQIADNRIDELTEFFQLIINSLDKVKSSADIDTPATNAINSLSLNLQLQPSLSKSTNNVLKAQYETFDKDLQDLKKYANVQVDYNAFATAINTQMSSMNCPIVITGSSDLDDTISLYKNMINLLKKTILTFISNMGDSVNKKYPEIGGENGKQNGTCLTSTYTSTDPTIGTCFVKMLPIQKWVNVIVSVYNQVIDIYVDGQLTSSCILKGFPNISTDPINITPNGGFSGKISRVVYMNTAMTVRKAKEIYYSGPVIVDSIFTLIPNWAYWTLLIIVIIAIVYSVFA